MTEIPPEQNPSLKTDMRRHVPLIMLAALYLACTGIALIQTMKKASPSDKSPSAGASALMKLKATGPANAIVPIYGVITVAEQGPMFRPMSADRIVRRLKTLSEKEDVKGVVLRINSPGGSVGAVQEIYDEILRLKNAGKNGVVSMGDVAASGGYYVSAPADRIFADAGSLTGSIGVIFEVGNVQELFKKIGVKIEAVKSAEHKDIASPFRAMTEKERQILQSVINDAYDQFVTAIVDGRKLDREKVLALADGRIYTGTQAKAEGLIDEIGNLEAAIAKCTELTGIKEKPRILYDEDPFEKFLSALQSRTTIWGQAASRFGVRFAYMWEYAL